MQRRIPRIVIAAVSSGSGKTTIVTGLLAALRARGCRVQSYKVGRDYIDPGYHEQASGRPGHNLDTWLVPREKLAEIFQRTMADADMAVIEGVMGLYDGGRSGISSTAEIAKLLQAPVLLVVDVKSMGASAAAIALGFKSYDPEVQLAGVILNRLGSETHRSMIEAAMQQLGIPVLGAVMRNEAMKLPERHLGLLPVAENQREAEAVHQIAESMARQLQVDAIIRLAEDAPEMQAVCVPETGKKSGLRIAVARDEAFSFYYPESLQVLEQLGAELCFFSPLHDAELPEAQGLILGGGFPEMFAQALYANETMRNSICAAAAAGMPVYAECGGFMYLMERLLDFDGKEFPMIGILPGTVQMNKKLQMVGYVEAELQRDTILGKKGSRLRGHEFHFSSECPENVSNTCGRAFEFTRMRNQAKYPAGYATDNILGSYLHLHFAGCPEAADSFVESCRQFQKKQQGA